MKKLWIPLIIVVVLVGGYLVFSSLANARASAAAAALKAAGCPTTVEELDPTFHAGSESTAKVYIQAAALLSDSDLARLKKLDDMGWQQDRPGVTAFLKDKSALYELVAQASAMPPADFGMNPREGLGAKIVPILKQYAAFRMLLRLEALELAAGGKADSALKALEVSTRLAHTFAEPMFIYHLVSMLRMDSVFSCAAQIAPKAGVPEIERLTAEFQKLDFKSFERRAFQAEVVTARVGIRGGQWVETEDASKLAVALARVLVPVRSYAAASYMEMVRRQLDVESKPWYEGRTKLAALDSLRQGKDLIDRVAGLYMVKLSAFYGRAEKATAWRDVAVLGLKALVMKKQTGKLPATLADIAADAPVDRFSGKPYVYKVLPDGFVVYSVGVNGNDDNGSTPDDLAFRAKL